MSPGRCGGARAVVVLWSPFPQRTATSGAVTYVHGDHLADWLLAQPRQLHPKHVAALAATDGRLPALAPGTAGVASGTAGTPPPARR